MVLFHVPSEMKTEKICLAAVQQNGVALKHVPREMRTGEICLVAVEQNYEALDFFVGSR